MCFPVQEAENRLENYKTKNWSSFENLRDRRTASEVEAAAIEAAEAGAWSDQGEFHGRPSMTSPVTICLPFWWQKEDLSARWRREIQRIASVQVCQATCLQFAEG